MAAFSDEFTDANGTDIAAHTPNVGTGWTHNSGNLGSIHLNDIFSYMATGAVAPASVVSDDLGSQAKTVWGQRDTTYYDSNYSLMCVRVVDGNNGCGVQYYGTGTLGRRLSDITGGTVTDYEQSDGSVSDEWIRCKVDSSNFLSMWVGATTSEPASPTADTNWTQVGTDHDISTAHNSTTYQGFIFQANTTAFVFSSYRADVISTGGTTFQPAWTINANRLLQ